MLDLILVQIQIWSKTLKYDLVVYEMSYLADVHQHFLYRFFLVTLQHLLNLIDPIWPISDSRFNQIQFDLIELYWPWLPLIILMDHDWPKFNTRISALF